MDSFKKELNDSDFEVVKVLPNTFHYGIILTGDARNLSKYFKEYLVNKPVELLLQEEEVGERGNHRYQGDQRTDCLLGIAVALHHSLC